jgi:DEAD/DEAH box helicase domain-containing protein
MERTQGDYATVSLAADRMPSGHTMYQRTINAARADDPRPDKMPQFELLMQYLDLEEAESLFAALARACSLSLLEQKMLQASWHGDSYEA